MTLAQRAWRKYTRDGLASLWEEGKYSLAESAPLRSFVTHRLLEKNNTPRIRFKELRDIAQSTGAMWDTFGESNAKIATEPIPPKTRVPQSSSFDQIKTDVPVSPAVMEFSDCVLIHPYGLTLCDRGVLQETIAKSTGSSSRIGKALGKSVVNHGYREIDRLIAGKNTDSLDSIPLATPLLPLWSNYYHWTVECLPRLAGVKRYTKETGKTPTIIVPENPSSWMIESLELLGIDKDRIQPLDTHYKIERLVVPTHPGPTPAECEWLRNQMTTAVEESTATSSLEKNRIYITRQNATRRRVKNEEELMERLRSYGFKRYELEDISVKDQVSLFTNADLIVAPHGAGLTNIIYSESPAIIELFGNSKKTTFYRLAKLLDQEYHYTHNQTHYNDIVADIAQIEDILRTIDEESAG